MASGTVHVNRLRSSSSVESLSSNNSSAASSPRSDKSTSPRQCDICKKVSMICKAPVKSGSAIRFTIYVCSECALVKKLNTPVTSPRSSVC
jgi:hypothetical protein